MFARRRAIFLRRLLTRQFQQRLNMRFRVRAWGPPAEITDIRRGVKSRLGRFSLRPWQTELQE